MATRYVSNFGADNNPGTEASPWKTLAVAHSRAASGDTIVLEDGVYREPLNPISGTTWKARNPGRAIIDGSAPQVMAWAKGSDGVWSVAWPGSAPMGLFLGTYEANGPYCCAYD